MLSGWMFSLGKGVFCDVYKNKKRLSHKSVHTGTLANKVSRKAAKAAKEQILCALCDFA